MMNMLLLRTDTKTIIRKQRNKGPRFIHISVPISWSRNTGDMKCGDWPGLIYMSEMTKLTNVSLISRPFIIGVLQLLL
jgi:hypothetical protein